jgi:hypothetical protein
MVLEDVTEFDYSGTHTKLPKILLNGNNVCMVSEAAIPTSISCVLGEEEVFVDRLADTMSNTAYPRRRRTRGGARAGGVRRSYW